MRDDIAALVALWDKKTTKKANSRGELLGRLGDLLREESAVGLAYVARIPYPGSTNGASWGFLGLTETRLLFLGNNTQSRIALVDIDELQIGPSGGDSFLSRMTLGGTILARVRSEEYFFEIQTQSSTGAFWSELERRWADAKEAEHSTPAPPNPQASRNCVADELSKLADLRANGILTDEEFTAQKQRLLSL